MPVSGRNRVHFRTIVVLCKQDQVVGLELQATRDPVLHRQHRQVRKPPKLRNFSTPRVRPSRASEPCRTLSARAPFVDVIWVAAQDRRPSEAVPCIRPETWFEAIRRFCIGLAFVQEGVVDQLKGTSRHNGSMYARRAPQTFVTSLASGVLSQGVSNDFHLLLLHAMRHFQISTP